MIILKRWLDVHGRKFQESDDKTFDLLVDGEYAELKAKAGGWAKFDFISLTQNQKVALGDKLKRIFVVLNVQGPDEPEVIEIPANELLGRSCNEITHYEWNKGMLADLFGR
jgi:hypothetical protein